MNKADHEFGARISVARTNRKPLKIVDEVRRKNDHLGRHGICAKRDQKNPRFMAQGHLTFWYPTRELRDKFIALVEEDCDPAVVIERRKRPVQIH